MIEATPEGAVGTSYAIYPASKGKFLKEDVAGQVGLYHDQYVRTARGWRFAVRLHETTPVVDGRPQDGKPKVTGIAGARLVKVLSRCSRARDRS